MTQEKMANAKETTQCSTASTTTTSTEAALAVAKKSLAVPGKCGCDFKDLGNLFLPKRPKRKETIRKQALPYGMSKYMVMLMGCISICLTSSLYYNWTIFEDLFVKEKILSGLCTDHERAIAKPDTFICDAQRREISNLYSVIMYTDSFVGSIGGYIGDCFGAYYALVIGQICGIIAFLMFYFFAKSITMFYVTFFFWGVSCSFALSPTWHYSRMFTFGNNMAVSVLTAADNLSMFTPTLLHMIVMRYKIGFSGAALTYIFWACLISLAITLFFIPKRFIVTDAEEEEDNQDLKSMFNESLGNALKDLRFWLSVTCYVLQCSVRLFYRRSFTMLFFDNEEVTEFLETASDLSFIGSFVLGYLNEYLGVVTMMSITTLMYILALVAVYFRNFTCAYTSALLFAIAQAGDIQQLITYIDEVFPEHESTLMGVSNIVNSIGGMALQIVFNYIFDYVGVHITVFLMILILVGVIAICYVIAFGLNPSKNKTQENKAKEEEKKEEEKKEEEKKEEGKLCEQKTKAETLPDEAEMSADVEEIDYNPSGPDLLLFNLFSAFLNFPYYFSLCIAVLFNNIGEHDAETMPRHIDDRVVRRLEREQFIASSNRIVELCGTVFSTSLIFLIGCMFEFSHRSNLMKDQNAFLTLMICLSVAAGGTSLILPFTQIFKVIPPLLAMGLTAVPPLAMLIFGFVHSSETASFTIMCGLVVAYGVVLFMAGNVMIYLNTMMGARFGHLIHALLGWSNLGTGYLYTLLLIFSIKVLYSGNSVIGGYVIVMPMQSGLCLLATFILFMYLRNERQYFNCWKLRGARKNNESTEQNSCGTNNKAVAVENSSNGFTKPHADYFDIAHYLSNGMEGEEELQLMFRSQYSTTWNSGLNNDYGLFRLNYVTSGIIQLSIDMLFLAISIVITLADVAIVFLLPRQLIQSAITVLVYFTVRMLFMFCDAKVLDKVFKHPSNSHHIFWCFGLAASVVLLLLNIFQMGSWTTTMEGKLYIIFCVVFGLRLLINSLVQHHILSQLERLKVRLRIDDKCCYAHNMVMYMNLGHCGGLVLFTFLCYRYLSG